MLADQSYIGKGRLFLSPYGGGAGGYEVGNVSKLEFSVSEEKKELLDYTSAGGGKRNSRSRITGVNVAMTLHDINSDNLSAAVFGSKAAVTAGAIVDEAITAYLGALSRTLYQIDTAVAPVVTHTTGTPTYVAGTDYEVTSAGIVALAGGAITAAQALKIDYTKEAGNVVEALTESSQEWVMTFVGLNEAQSGKAVTIDIHRIKFGPLSNLSVIADDFAGLELSGEALSDATKVGASISKYFKVTQAS